MTVRQAFLKQFRGKGNPWAMQFLEAWDEMIAYDQAHRTMVAKAGTTRFLKHLERYYPEKSICPKDYRPEWRRAIWAAAYDAYQEYKTMR